MPRDLVLHIGTTKTGSTSIQHVLSRHRNGLLQQGVLYPRSPGEVQHDLLAYAAMSNIARRDGLETNLWRGMQPAVRLDLFRQEFEQEMRGIPAEVKRVVISSEFLYIMLHKPAELQAVRAMLTPWFSDISIVVYLRRQDAHFTSLYTQILRTGEVTPPDKLKLRARPSHDLDYAGLIGMWEGVFGEGSVTPRLFEKSGDRRFDAVEDFAGVCGITLPQTEEDAPQESNQSMDLAGQALLVELGRMIQNRDKIRNVASPVWRNLTAAITAASPGRGWRPTRAQAASLVAQYAEGNERVRQRWFPDRATLFSEYFSDLPEQPIVPTPAELTAAACRTILELATRENARDLKTAQEAVREARKLGDPARLRAALGRLLHVDIDNVEARVALAELHIADGKLSVAQGLLDAAAKLKPDHPGVRRVTGALAKKDGSPKTTAPAAP